MTDKQKQNWLKAIQIAEIILPIYNRQLSSGYPAACIDKLKWTLENNEPFEWVIANNAQLPIGLATAVSCASSVSETLDSLSSSLTMELAMNEMHSPLLISASHSTELLRQWIETDDQLLVITDEDDNNFVKLLIIDAIQAAHNNDPYRVAAIIYGATVYLPLRNMPSLPDIALEAMENGVMFDESLRVFPKLETSWNNEYIINQLQQLT